MKKLFLLSVVGLFSTYIMVGQIQQLDQKELIKQLYGTWKLDVINDTVFYGEVFPAETAIQLTNYFNINGKRHVMNTSLIVFNAQKNKFESTRISTSGVITTTQYWFTDQKTLHSEHFNNSGIMLFKSDFRFENPVTSLRTIYNQEGVKSGEDKFTKTSGVIPVSPEASLNQTELIKKLIGTWLIEETGDTISGLEFESFGKAYTASDIRMVKGKKIYDDKALMAYSKADNNWKLYVVFPSGGYLTRVFSFVSENKGIQVELNNFNQQKAGQTIVFEFLDARTFKASILKLNGDLVEEVKFVKQ